MSFVCGKRFREGWWRKEIRVWVRWRSLLRNNLFINIKVSGKWNLYWKVTIHYHNFHSLFPASVTLRGVESETVGDVKIPLENLFPLEHTFFCFPPFDADLFHVLNEEKTLCHFDGLSRVVNFTSRQGGEGAENVQGNPLNEINSLFKWNLSGFWLLKRSE